MRDHTKLRAFELDDRNRYGDVMKKITRVAGCGLLFFFLLIFVAPYSITLKPVQTALKQQLESRLNLRSDFDKISWTWFPGPCISFSGIEVSDDRFKTTLPCGTLFADWTGLLSGKPEIKIELRDPDIIIKTLSKSDSDAKTASAHKKKPTLPSMKVVVKNGHILLPSDGFFKALANQTPQLEIFDLDAAVSIAPNAFDLKSACRLTFAKKINADVSFKKQKQKEYDGLKTYWNLDIQGQEINLTEVNEKIMLLFGKNDVAKLICGIVRGGGAKTGGYVFSGYTGDFERLDSMVITAFADNATIRIPKVNLHLENATGPVRIENSVLTGRNLSAELGNSRGRNGILELDLDGNDPGFNLDLDLDADISELPALLRDNIFRENEEVKNELARMKSAKGRAQGRLSLGDKLAKLKTKVAIFDSDSSIGYQRLMYPVGIRKGVIEISPDKCAWSNINGSIGPHLIHDSKGSVQWAGTVRLDIEKTDADLESGSLFDELKSWPRLKKRLTPMIHSIKGGLEIRGLQVKGAVRDLENLKYNMTINTKNLDIHTPLLPGPGLIITANAEVGNDKILISDCRMNISDQRLDIKTDLDHASWKDFKGSLELKGTCKQNLGQWIKTKGWIPLLYFPRTPCTIDPMILSFQKNGMSVKGTLITKQDQKNEIKTRIDLEMGKNRLTVKELTIDSPEEKANLRIDLDRSDGSIDAGFKGSLSRDTLCRIIEDNRLLSGKIGGNCELKYSFTKRDAYGFSGSLEMAGFSFYSGDDMIRINNAKINGHESLIEIEGASLALNDELVLADGRVALFEADIVIDLNIESDYVSTSNLLRILESLKKEESHSDDSRTHRGQPESGSSAHTALSGHSVTGDINFDFEQFEYNPDISDKSPETEKYVWDNLSGKITLKEEERVSVSVVTGEICGIQTTGVLNKAPDRTSLKVSTDKKVKNDLQELFACIGIKKQNMTGLFSLDAKIEGVPDNWENGHVEFECNNGKIKNFTALSKLLTIVNVADLFSLHGIKDFFSTGYPYSKAKLTGKISDNSLIINDFSMIGNGLNMFASGTIGFNKQMDIIVLVKPFKVIDSILTVIPWVGMDLGDGQKAIALIPIQVKGKPGDPEVSLYTGKHLNLRQKHVRDFFKKTASLPSKTYRFFESGDSGNVK
ncbi:MAG: DUF3971 domain-containing protein [Deltaproteobacteria bacterium]|jgi:hypothetical protein|nr:DUF3971 domain-containing protein [Deltaproteobacteria bacterium]